MVSTAGLLPATRFAVDAYVNFVRDRSLLEAVASCLTEMFSPQIIAERVEGMLRNYDFVTRDTLAYFTPRLTQAPTDVAFALAYVKEHADTPEKQQLVLDTLRFKCDVLWAQLDALYFAYVEPGADPAGRLRPVRPREMTGPRKLAGDAMLRFPAHVKFRFDERRQAWIVLSPERLFLPDEQAVEILRLIDGARTVDDDRRRARRRVRCAARGNRRRCHRDAAGTRRQTGARTMSDIRRNRRWRCWRS